MSQGTTKASLPPRRPLVLPPAPDGLAEWRAKLARLPQEDEIDEAQEYVFRSRDGYEFSTREYNVCRRWRRRGVEPADLSAVMLRWRRIAAHAEKQAQAQKRQAK